MAAGKVFLSYSSKDRYHLTELRQRARRLEEAGLVSVWHDQEVVPGAPWAEAIRRELDTARLVVPLVSANFLESAWCFSELERALERRDRELIDVVPVIVSQCDWRTTVLGAVQSLPKGGAPIETWPDPGVAWSDVVDGLEGVLRGQRTPAAVPSREELIRQCADRLDGARRLMLLAPWRGGLEELAQEIARRTHGDDVTTLRVPAVENLTEAAFYAELSGDTAVTTQHLFRDWLKRRTNLRRRTGHLVVLPYFGGPRALVKELGHVMRAVFDEVGTFSLLVLGLARCAELLREVQDLSLFAGIVTQHVQGMDTTETGTLLQRLGADPAHAPVVQTATGGHPEWTALVAPEVRGGRLHGIPKYLSNTKLFGVLRDRLVYLERDRGRANHAATTLEKLLEGRAVVRLSDARDDLTYPEVRLYFDGVLDERNDETVFRCDAAKLAAERALGVWRLQP